MPLDLDDLQSFFESEPIYDESDVSWEYSGVACRFVTAQDDVSCRLAPGQGELTLMWRQGGLKRLELSLDNLFLMKIESQSGIERLVAIPEDSTRQPFVLQLRPHIFVALGSV